MADLRKVFAATVLIVVAGIGAPAQEGAKEKFAQAQKQNAVQLRQYGWTTRTELRLKGESKSVKTESVRYDAGGQLLKTTISDTPQKQPPSGGRLKQKVVEKKTDEFKDILEGLAKLAQSYAHLTPQQTQAFAQGAAISKGDGPMAGTLQIQGSNVVVSGDSVTVRVDGTTFLIRQVNIDSVYESNPVKLTVAFQSLPQGPTYPAQVDLSYPKKEIQVTVTNSNYQRLQAAGPSTSAAPNSAPAPPADEGWPRKRVIDGTTLISYQPQVDDWKEFQTLDWRMAFSLTPKGGKAVIGAASMEAQTNVDSDTHTVLIHDIKLRHTDFPSLDAGTAARMEQSLRTFLPPTVTISLERIIACTPKKDSAPTVQLKNDPPVIFVSYKPAVLLDIDGDPVSVPIQNTNLEFVLNTPMRIIRDKSDSRYYFLVDEQWLTSADLKGPWSAASRLPKDLEVAAQDEHFADIKDFVPLRPPKAGAVVPAVFYSTGPAEVILFDGQPAYAPIPGTQLSYASNTVSYVFTHTSTNQVYFLTTGRWFSASSLGGPWTFATPNLPPDFAKIPASSPAAQVLASVPGTEEAKDAVLMAQIPTTAVVDPKAAAESAKVAYDGNPKFAPIQGTSMQYATNTSQKVVKVGDVYYLCLQGVWFFATTPQGPWQTAPSVPQKIYTIPPSSPVYNITYVTQTTTSGGDIEASYTAGYVGAFVIGAATGAIIAGGTGYYYPPYVGYYPGYVGFPPYYAAPYTYGAGAYYNSATGRYGVSQTAYGPYGSATRGATYNPYTGTSARYGSVSTPYGRASAGQAYNPYTGAYGATRQGSNAYSQWGSSVVSKNGQTAYTQHYSDARGTAGSVQTSQGGKAVGGVGAGGNSGFAGKTASGDMYAGHDGNVYKNTGSGWQKYNNGSGSWSSVNTPSQERTSGAASPQARPESSGAAQRAPSQGGGGSQMQSLQSEAANRQRGAQSSQRFQQRSSGGGGFGGGGRSFGGGRRR
ncbi:MAG TPA: hypothetical protein VMJ75_30520 [Candidatus Acidoferrales bacterium]|nr:hypothetical protein [Candidatus Acidoferrales bacterium]